MAKALENFGKVSPGLTLDDDGDCEEFEVLTVYPMRHIGQGFRHPGTEIDLIEGLAEFGSHRVAELLGHHSQACGKGMAGFERTGNELESFRELSFKFFYP